MTIIVVLAVIVATIIAIPFAGLALVCWAIASRDIAHPYEWDA